MNERPTPVHADAPSVALPMALPAWAASLRYASLRTFRSDGTAVDAPTWFAVDGSAVLVRTPTATPKVRRIRADSRVELRPCDWKGRPLDGEVVRGTAEVLDRPDALAAEPILRARYGWQWNWVPMVPVPGVKSAHRGLGIRRRLELARATELWEESCILRITPLGELSTSTGR